MHDVVRLLAGTPAPKAPLWNPSWSRFAGHYSNDAGETEVVELNQRLVIINSDGDSRSSGWNRWLMGASGSKLPPGGGPVGESVHFVEENGRVVRMYTGESFSNRVNP